MHGHCSCHWQCQLSECAGARHVFSPVHVVLQPAMPVVWGVLLRRYSNAPMQQIYTCAGSDSGPEVYRTQFTYYGFRYIGITGCVGTTASPL